MEYPPVFCSKFPHIYMLNGVITSTLSSWGIKIRKAGHQLRANVQVVANIFWGFLPQIQVLVHRKANPYIDFIVPLLGWGELNCVLLIYVLGTQWGLLFAWLMQSSVAMIYNLRVSRAVYRNLCQVFFFLWWILRESHAKIHSFRQFVVKRNKEIAQGGVLCVHFLILFGGSRPYFPYKMITWIIPTDVGPPGNGHVEVRWWTIKLGSPSNVSLGNPP